MTPRRVWIDTDVSAAPGGHECDDAFALLHAFGSPEIELIGLSSVFGNAELPIVDAILRDMAVRFGPKDVAVHTGASAAGAGMTDAAHAIGAAAEQAPLTVVALGPLTNVGALLTARPELAGRIDELVCVAGRRPGQSFRVSSDQQTPFRDLNFELDPAAMAAVLATSVPVTLAPWEASRALWFGDAELARLEAGNPACRWLAGPARDWLEVWRRDMKAPGFTPFDTIATGWMTAPELLPVENLAAVIEDADDDRTPGAAKPHLHVRPGEGRKLRYISGAADGFANHVLTRMGA